MSQNSFLLPEVALVKVFYHSDNQRNKDKVRTKGSYYYMFKVMERPEDENLEPEHGIVTT